MLNRIWKVHSAVSLGIRVERQGADLSLSDSYLIQNGIVYLTIADKSYPRKLAFSYLDELSKEFERSYAGMPTRVGIIFSLIFS